MPPAETTGGAGCYSTLIGSTSIVQPYGMGNERKSGAGCDSKGLKKWWTEWLKGMAIQNVEDEFFFKRQDAVNLTEDQIKMVMDKR